MPSDALIRWMRDRCEVLDSLEAIHAHVTGGRRERRTVTEHLTYALIVRLASEFQGYCRDLHDDAAIRIVSGLPEEFASRVPVVLAVLVKSRKLDRGNAAPGNIGADFGNLGVSLWPWRWRRSLNSAAVGLDGVVGAYLDDLTGQAGWG